MIYIGTVFGGPELREAPIAQAIAKVVRGCRVASEGEFGSLDIVFHVAGSLLTPEFEGVRTGRFSQTERMLQVQIAVPAEVVQSDNPYPFLADRVVEAVQAAAPKFANAGIAYPEREYLEVAEGLRRLETH